MDSSISLNVENEGFQIRVSDFNSKSDQRTLLVINEGPNQTLFMHMGELEAARIVAELQKAFPEIVPAPLPPLTLEDVIKDQMMLAAFEGYDPAKLNAYEKRFRQFLKDNDLATAPVDEVAPEEIPF